jgi:hypothetical protein
MLSTIVTEPRGVLASHIRGARQGLACRKSVDKLNKGHSDFLIFGKPYHLLLHAPQEYPDSLDKGRENVADSDHRQ